MAEHRQQEEIDLAIRLDRLRFNVRIIIVLFVVLVVTFLVYVSTRLTNSDNGKKAADSQKTKAESSITAANSTINAQVGLANKGRDIASAVALQCKADKDYRRENPSLCVSASSLATASPKIVAGPTGPIGPAANVAQIQAAVNNYLSTYPPPIDYGRLRLFVNSWLAGNSPSPGVPGSNGASGESGLPGSPGASGESGQPGVNGANGNDGTSGTSGTDGKDGVSVVDITSLQDGNTVTLTFLLSDQRTIPVSFILPNNCPSTRVITPPDPGIAGASGDPTSPYPVCVPTE